MNLFYFENLHISDCGTQESSTRSYYLVSRKVEFNCYLVFVREFVMRVIFCEFKTIGGDEMKDLVWKKAKADQAKARRDEEESDAI